MKTGRKKNGNMIPKEKNEGGKQNNLSFIANLFSGEKPFTFIQLSLILAVSLESAERREKRIAYVAEWLERLNQPVRLILYRQLALRGGRRGGRQL